MRSTFEDFDFLRDHQSCTKIITLCFDKRPIFLETFFDLRCIDARVGQSNVKDGTNTVYVRYYPARQGLRAAPVSSSRLTLVIVGAA
jgi:hypothetical protein